MKRHDPYSDRSPSVSDVKSLMSHLTTLIQDLIHRSKPDFIVPLESKGALMLEMGLDGSMAHPPLIYPRAFDFLSPETIAKSKFLVVDDTVFSGRTLGKTKKHIERGGAKEIDLAALFDFSYLYGAEEIDQDVLKKTHILIDLPLGSKGVAPQAVLCYLQEAVLSERMPATCDHLLFESEARDAAAVDDTIDEIMDEFSESGRLLFYGRRGSYFTASILLDDLFEADWATPAKVRIWYNEKKKILRLAPIAHRPSGSKSVSPLAEEILRLFAEARPNLQPIDYLESNSLADRMSVMRYVAGFPEKYGFYLRLEERHLRRFYPDELGTKIIATLSRAYSALDRLSLPGVDKVSNQPINYVPAAARIISLLKTEYESQGEEGKRKREFESRGFTVNEIVKKLSGSFSKETVHAAVDYCYDTILLTSFNRITGDTLARCARTTEIVAQQHYLPAEVFGTAIIYSDEQKTPVWIPNKVYSILERSLGLKLESLTAKRDFFGDRTSIAISEGTERMWSTFRSDLWKTDCESDLDSEDRVFLSRLVSKEEEASSIISSDPRISGVQSKIDAIHHLARQGGYEATVLANILGDEYGGATFIAFNMNNILQLGLDIFVEKNSIFQIDYRRHTRGLETKLLAIQDGKNHLEKLERRATQLRYQTRTIAQQFVRNLKMLQMPNSVYASLNELWEAVKTAHGHLSANDFPACLAILQSFGLTKSFDQPLHPVRIMQMGNHILMDWLIALGGRPRPTYRDFTFESNNHETERIVLCYDLRKIRREIPKRHNIPLKEVNRNIHGLIANWVIAFGGRLSPTSMNQGDRRYAFFDRESDALNAARWIVSHSSLLNGVNPSFTAERPLFGIGLGKGFIRLDDRGGQEADILDQMGHESKKEQIDDLADNIAGKKEEDSVWVLSPDQFPTVASNNLIIKRSEGVDGIPIASLRTEISDSERPWRNKVR